MKPTGDQIRKFWEWCGFRRKLSASENPHYWLAPNAKMPYGNKLPRIDLNNLFIWAVPKLIVKLQGTWSDRSWLPVDVEASFTYYAEDKEWFCAIIEPRQSHEELEPEASATDEDPALALFWATYKAAGLEA